MIRFFNKGKRSRKTAAADSARTQRPQTNAPSSLLLMPLEPRLMFDGAIVATGAEVAHTADHPDIHMATPPAVESGTGARNVLFVDSRVKDADVLTKDVAPDTDIVYLKSNADGLQQISDYLAAHPGADSAQIIAHGNAGDMWLGDTYLSAENIQQHAGELQQIGSELKDGGDILLYACNTAAGDRGMAFVDSFAYLTGHDIAASSNRTGAGSDWNLEITTGQIDAAPVLSATSEAAYTHDLAMITVTSNADSGAGTLRQALTDATSGDTITFNAGMTVSLTSGELAISKNLTIDGDLDDNGTADVTIDAGYHSRVLNITAGTVTLDGLILQHGLLSGAGANKGEAGGSSFGAGISNAGTLTLKDVTVTNNYATGGGGAVPTGAYAGGGGGGGSGVAGIGGAKGGDTVGSSTYSGQAGGGGSGGNGGSYNGDKMVGHGGTSGPAAYGIGGGLGGTGANYRDGGAGGTATVGGISIGGGGGGSGWNGTGGLGGNAAGGIYNSGTIYVIGSSAITNNAAAGGGGGGGGTGGTGGIAAGGIWNTTAGKLYMTSAAYSAMAGNAAEGGFGGFDPSHSQAASGAASAKIYNASGTVDTSYSPVKLTSATYDASTGTLSVTGTDMTTGDTIDPSKLTLTGQGNSTYTLTTGSVTASSATSFSITLNAADKLAVNGLLNKNGTNSVDATTFNLAGAANWDSTSGASADTTGNGITVSNVSSPTITSATYDSSTHVLTVTGTGLVGTVGANNDITVSKLTLTGEGGTTYTLTSSDVEVTSGTSFSVTLNATDRGQVEMMFNINGSESINGTTYNLAAADDWNSVINNTDISDSTADVNVSNVAVPVITSATYDANTGALVVAGTGFHSVAGTSDIVANKFTFTGEGGATYTMTDTSDVEITSGTSFTLNLSATDKAAINQIVNKNGTGSTGGTTYNLAAAQDWAAVGVVADTTGNGITVSNVAVPAITSATYDANTGTLTVTGAGFLSASGATNDIVANKFTFTGEGGSTYTLTDTSNVEITSGTSFTLNLSATDKAGISTIVNKNGTSSTGGTTYNIAAAEDWAAGADAAVVVADTTGNGITVSNVAVPAITSATYDANTGALTVTGTGFLSASGATNDIVANKFTFTGEGGSTYTLTDTSNVEITSGTSFTLNLSATDKAGISTIVNKNGTSSTGGTTYNIAAAEDWAAGADAAVVVADTTGNGITVSNVAVPAITSATYDANTGALTVTGTGFLSASGATNDIVANKFTFTGEGGSTYTLTDTSNVEITSGTSFTLSLSATDKAAINQIGNKNGTNSTSATAYNIAAAEDWAAGADAAVVVADTTGNGVTVSNVAVPAITSATYNANTGALTISGTGFLSASGATNDIVANKFTFTGEGGSTYTLTDTSNVEITSGTSFTLNLSATDKAAINQIVNKNGTSSTGGTTYNIAAAEDWAAGADAAVVVADTTGNGITVSNVAVPAITSATYNASTGTLDVTGTGFLSISGATNDIVANKFTFTGEGGSTYTLTDTANVEITSGTSFTLTLSATDKAAINLIVNKNGTSSTDATTYNIAAAEDWAAGADAAVTVADLTGNGITASHVDALPVVSQLNGDNVSFTENGSAALLDSGSDATVADSDNTDFNGGNVTVSIIANRVSTEDVLGIVNQGTGAGQIGISGSNVTYSGTTIGTFTGGSGTSDLVVTLNGNATPAATQALVRDLTYSNSNTTDPSVATRTVRVTVNDGSGGTSTNADISVGVTAVNDAPTISATGATPTFTENGSAVSLFSGTSISTVESGQTIKSLTLTVNNVSDGSSELLNIDGTSVALTNGNTATTATNGMDVSVSVAGGTATVTISKTAGIGTTAAQTVVNGLSYQDTSDNPSTANRVVTITSIQDNGGTSNGGSDTAAPSIAATVTVTAVNDASVVTTSGGTVAFTEGNNMASTPVAIDTGITVSDIDNGTLSSTTVSITGNFHSSEDVLAFTNDGSTMGNIAASYNSSTGVLTLTSSDATATTAEWQAALRTVTYTNSSDTPDTSSRTISFTVNDGSTDSSAATKTVSVTAVNDIPVATTSGGTTAFIEGNNITSTPVAVDSGIAVSDADNGTLSSATVAITGNFQSGEDALAFTNDGATMGNISASYNSATGVLTLTSSSATATTAEWQAALRTVTYTNSSDTPNIGNRTVSFTINDGSADSSTTTKAIGVTATNDSPVATTSGSTTAFIEGNNTTSTPVVIDGGITVSDIDNSALSSATVSITGNFQSSGDVLAFTNDGATMGNIAASYDSSTGVLTLTSSDATATTAQWQAALRTITYTNSSDTPSTGSRTISFTVNDGTDNSSAATKTVSVAATNDTPIATTSGGTAAFTEGNNVASTPVAIDSGITVSDADNGTLASAEVSITGNFHSAEDVLAFTNDGATMGNIGASYNSTTGVLTLTSSGSTATTAQWQAALGSVTYTNSSDTPDTGSRTISFTVNDGSADSSAVTKTVSVTATDDSPVATTSGGTSTFIEGNNTTSIPVVIDGGITVSDADNGALSSATVSITGNFHSGEDVLAFTNDGATMGNIGASYNSATGVLTLSSSGATATTAQWQAALDSVSYTNSSDTPDTGNRTVSFTVNDGSADSSAAIKTVSVTATNDTPIATASSDTTAFTEGNNVAGTPVAVDSGITVGDPDNGTFASATVSITGNFHGNEDILAFTNDGGTMGNIAASYNSATGVLTLTSSDATATNAQWQAALRSVTYTNSSETPNTSNRTISFTVNDGTDSSSAATKTVSVISTNDTPVLSTNTGATLDSGTSVTLTSAMLQASDADNSAGQLSFTLQSTPARGEVLLGGSVLHAGDSFTQTDIAAGNVVYRNLENPGSDSFAFTVSDGAGGNIAQTTFALTVNPVPLAPTLLSTPVPVSTTPTSPPVPEAPLPPSVLSAFTPGSATSPISLISAPSLDSHADFTPLTVSTPPADSSLPTASDHGAPQETAPLGNPASFVVIQTPSSSASDTAPGLRANVSSSTIAVSADARISIALPRETFIDTMPHATVSVQARLANGEALPAWLHFDARSGTFQGQPPAGWDRPLELQVVARDNHGNQAVAIVRLKFDRHGAQDAPPPPAGHGHQSHIQGDARDHGKAADPLAWLHQRHAPRHAKAALDEQFARHGGAARLREQNALIAHAESLARTRVPS